MNQDVTIICGTEQLDRHPLPPYSDVVCSFLDAFGTALRKDPEAKQYPDVMTFAFWARKGSIGKHREEYLHSQRDGVRLGRGIVFHIAPSNVPVNSMFTYAFGLISGNANIVRIPSKEFPQVVCMCRVLNEVLKQDGFKTVLERTLIVRYDRALTEPTKRYSALCDVRVIWGGDETIRAIRRAELPPRSTEITFADRYSFGIIDPVAVLNASEQEIRTLAEHFYNDTYLMDQNACSAPHLICWNMIGKNSSIRDCEDNGDRENSGIVGEENLKGNEQLWYEDEKPMGSLKEKEDKICMIREAQSRFWDAVYDVAKKYELADIKASEKFAMVCEQAALSGSMTEVIRRDNVLYRCELQELQEDVVTACRGKYGLFYEYVMESFDALAPLSDTRVQTCAVYGIDVRELQEYIVEHGFRGIDRVVPFGKTLDIDTVWDGYDLVNFMSREIAGV